MTCVLPSFESKSTLKTNTAVKN